MCASVSTKQRCQAEKVESLESALTGLIPAARVKVGMPVSFYGHEGSCPRDVFPCKQFSQVLSCGRRGEFHFGPRLQVGCPPALSHSIWSASVLCLPLSFRPKTLHRSLSRHWQGENMPSRRQGSYWGKASNWPNPRLGFKQVADKSGN